MTNQNPFMALMLWTTLLLSVNAETNKSGVSDITKAVATIKSIEELGEVARDAIGLTIAEVNHTKDFINLVPQLKSLQNSKDVRRVELRGCVEGIVDGMTDVVGKLKQLGKLDSTFLKRDSKSLRASVNGVLSFEGLCRRALADEADATVKLLLHRKLEDTVLITSDVVFRVRKFYNAKLKP